MEYTIVGIDPDDRPKGVRVGKSGHLPEAAEIIVSRRPTTAQTNALLWDSSAQIVCYGILVTSKLANDVTLNIGGTEIDLFLANTGGAVISFGEGGVKLPEGGTITFTSTVATNHTVAAWGRTE